MADDRRLDDSITEPSDDPGDRLVSIERRASDELIPYMHVPWAVVITDQLGGTVGLREVLELAVVDYGNNELWRGTPGRQPAYQIHTQTRATKVGANVAGADHLTTY